MGTKVTSRMPLSTQSFAIKTGKSSGSFSRVIKLMWSFTPPRLWRLSNRSHRLMRCLSVSHFMMGIKNDPFSRLGRLFLCSFTASILIPRSKLSVISRFVLVQKAGSERRPSLPPRQPFQGIQGKICDRISGASGKEAQENLPEGFHGGHPAVISELSKDLPHLGELGSVEGHIPVEVGGRTSRTPEVEAHVFLSPDSPVGGRHYSVPMVEGKPLVAVLKDNGR